MTNICKCVGKRKSENVLSTWKTPKLKKKNQFLQKRMTRNVGLEEGEF